MAGSRVDGWFGGSSSEGFNDMNARAGHAVSKEAIRGRVCIALVGLVIMVASPRLEAMGRVSAQSFDGLVFGDGYPQESGLITSEPDGASGERVWESDAHGTTLSGGAVAPADVPATANPSWDVTVDAMLLWQGNAQSLPLFLDSYGQVGFDSQDLKSEAGAGVRVGLIRQLGERHAIEGNYFQARPFNAQGKAPKSGGPYELTNTGDLLFNDIASAVITSGGSIQSAEVNWRKQETWSPITWLVGFRWVELNSQIQIDYEFANPDPFGSGDIDTDVGNNLYGGQFGADMLFWNAGGKWRVNGVGKAGLFYNAASYQRSTAGFFYQDGTPFPIGSVSATADQTSFFGEVGLNSTWWITNWLAWRAGYSVFWASGVAVAAEQLPLNSFGDGTATINTNGSVLLHGATTGLEARW